MQSQEKPSVMFDNSMEKKHKHDDPLAEQL